MKTILTMILEGVALYVFISNFAVTLMALKIVSDISMFSAMALVSAFVFSLIMAIIFVIFATLSNSKIQKTGYIPFPFVVVQLEDDFYSEKTQEERMKLKKLMDDEVEKIMNKIDDIDISLDKIEKGASKDAPSNHVSGSL